MEEYCYFCVAILRIPQDMGDLPIFETITARYRKILATTPITFASVAAKDLHQLFLQDCESYRLFWLYSLRIFDQITEL